jgi:hypothetical protein
VEEQLEPRVLHRLGLHVVVIGIELEPGRSPTRPCPSPPARWASGECPSRSSPSSA